jgi:2Fe-2S ferredoxin
MVQICVVERTGAERVVDVQEGYSLMEVIRDNGFDELLGTCGGCALCSTCHVYLDDAHLSLAGEMGPDEDALLDGASFRTGQSRLSCQIEVTAALEGLKVTIAPED